MTMSNHQPSIRRVRRLAPLALFIVMILPLRLGWGQEQPAQHDQSQQDHSQMQHDHSQMQHDHSQHGAQPAKKSKVESKSKASSKKKVSEKHSGHTPSAKSGNSKHDGHVRPKTGARTHAGHAAGATSSKQHGGHDMPGHHGGMVGFLGPYSINREGSGTSWLPATTPHEGVHGQYGDWITMWHALFNGVYDH